VWQPGLFLHYDIARCLLWCPWSSSSLLAQWRPELRPDMIREQLRWKSWAPFYPRNSDTQPLLSPLLMCEPLVPRKLLQSIQVAIGQELGTAFETPRDLPPEMAVLLKKLQDA
jgi:hypothetical protein